MINSIKIGFQIASVTEMLYDNNIQIRASRHTLMAYSVARQKEDEVYTSIRLFNLLSSHYNYFPFLL